jgi:hypothetical protein
MASTMLQVDIVQENDEIVTSVPPIVVRVFEFLSFGQTTVREISAEKEGGILAGASATSVGFSSIPYAVLTLFLRGGEPVFFLAPSHVSSPPFEAGAAILEIRDGGVTSIGDTQMQVARRIGGHAYLDEESQP